MVFCPELRLVRAHVHHDTSKVAKEIGSECFKSKFVDHGIRITPLSLILAISRITKRVLRRSFHWQETLSKILKPLLQNESGLASRVVPRGVAHRMRLGATFLAVTDPDGQCGGLPLQTACSEGE